jgi:hypothetical protein
MKKVFLFTALLVLTGCVKESHDVVCVADFSPIPYHTRTQGPVFTVTVEGKTYLTFLDNNGERKTFDERYMCRIGN